MIVYSSEAARDVARLHDWLAAASVRAAALFMDWLAKAERGILARPLLYRVLSDGETRRCSFRLNRTSYLVDYRVEPKRIAVVRVWHGRQERPK